ATATATHSLTLYRHSSGALVFGAGTVQWAWGLDDRGGSAPDQAMQQATVNLLADMGAQPGSIQLGAGGTLLQFGVASTEGVPPPSSIVAPAAGAVVQSGAPVTITGTASDAAPGAVAGVEVSVDGGATWHGAQGANSWSYVWTPGPLGPATILSRAIDDSGNRQAPAASGGGTVPGGRGPCTSLFDPTTTVPGTPSVSDPVPIELGVRFKSDISGFITGIRFYKGAGNIGQHIGSLWTNTGTRLAGPVTFTSQTATGWQQMSFQQPGPIAANTAYVASAPPEPRNYAADHRRFL